MSESLIIQSSGSGPDLVMLHGWAMHSAVWGHLADYLSNNFSVHQVDLPGHGLNRDSRIPLTENNLVQTITERIPRAVWLGWSLGGLVALNAARYYPTAVSHLVLIAASPCFVQQQRWTAAVESRVFEQFAHDLEENFETTLERFLALETIGAKNAKAVLRRLKNAINAAPSARPEALKQGLAVLQNTDLRHALPGIDIPTLWIGGRRDRLIPAAAIQQAAAQMPNAVAQLIPGAGHAPFIGHGAIIAQWIKDLTALSERISA